MAKLVVVSQGRMERIVEWVSQYDNYEQLQIALSDILSQLVFGTVADKFDERSMSLARLWDLSVNAQKKSGRKDQTIFGDWTTRYILWECKSEVDLTRTEINKRETEQMNRSCAWFGKHYPGCRSKLL